MDTKQRMVRIFELLEEMTPANSRGALVQYDVPGGPVPGRGLIKDDEVAVQDDFMPAGCMFPRHPHDGIWETLKVVNEKGRLAVDVDGEMTVLTKGQSITFEPGVAHQVTAVEDTRIIAITVPGDEGYPDGPS